MSLKLLIDMNLSPEWVAFLTADGWHAEHWSTVGDPKAEDREIMAWALTHGFLVFTHDLDFGTARPNKSNGPERVLQLRTQHVLPEQVGAVVLAAINRFKSELSTGALVVVELARHRVRVLPL